MLLPKVIFLRSGKILCYHSAKIGRSWLNQGTEITRFSTQPWKTEINARSQSHWTW
jgi:hypothetical protein